MKRIKKSLILIMFIFLFSLFSCAKGNNEIHYEEKDYTNSKISYLGPKGTYSEEACEVFFKNKGAYIPYDTVQASVDALTNNEVQYALIPQENTIGGPVIEYVDIVLTTDNLSIQGEVELTINQNLLAKSTAKLENIKTIYSHKQGISQSKDWLNKNLPNAKIVEVSSTALGAKMVSESEDLSVAAIASAGAAKVYNLNVLEKSIQGNDNNKTRFYILSKEEASKASLNRLVFIAKGNSANLPSLMTKINNNGKKLITIHERPLKTILGQYYYLIELENCNYDEYEKIIKNESFEFRYMGSFVNK